MLTEEEFAVFQEQLVELGQENFRLKEELDSLVAQNAEIPKLKAEIEECDSRKAQMAKEHAETIEVLKNELARLQTEAQQQAETNSKMISERLNEVNQQIAEVTRQTKEKEEQIEQLKQQAKAHEVRVQQKVDRLNKIQSSLAAYRPLLVFLQQSRGIPMYLEDMQTQIATLESVKAKEAEELASLDKDVTELHKLNEELDRSIKEKTRAIEEANEQYQQTTNEIEETRQRIAVTKASIEDTEQKIEQAREEVERQKSQMEAKFEELALQKKEKETESARLQTEVDKLHAEIADMEKETENELAGYNQRIKELRKRLSTIRETGEDEDVPRVDKELQNQIARIIQEKEVLQEKSQMLDQAIALVQDEIAAKDKEIQTITLRMAPTPRILAMPEFQQKQLILEELVLQNRELQDTFAELTAKIEETKAQSAKLREAIAKQSP